MLGGVYGELLVDHRPRAGPGGRTQFAVLLSPNVIGPASSIASTVRMSRRASALSVRDEDKSTVR
jgi:hypothetical protein